jgi:hypothetical protein
VILTCAAQSAGYEPAVLVSTVGAFALTAVGELAGAHRGDALVGVIAIRRFLRASQTRSMRGRLGKRAWKVSSLIVSARRCAALRRANGPLSSMLTM